MFKNLARGLLAAMPAAVAATTLASPFQHLDLVTVPRVRCNHMPVAP